MVGLCSFLGLSPSAEELEKVKAGVMFDNMKQNSMINFSTIKMMDQKVSPFMRKGTQPQTNQTQLVKEPYYVIRK